MLVELAVSRIALIESLHVQFGPGMSAFTGETGAGKSILLDAIGLLLGNRASQDFIRNGCESGYVEAQFSFPNFPGPLADMLTTWGMEPESMALIITRELYRSGRTVGRINGRMATVQMLKELGAFLVQQHGQHDSTGLLRAEEQLRLLDLFARNGEYQLRVKAAYHSWRQAVDLFHRAKMDEQERIRRIDMLTYQINEIDRCQLTMGEEESLRDERRKLQFADKIYQAITSAIDTLEGGQALRGVSSSLTNALHQVELAAMHDAVLAEIVPLLQTAQVHVDETTLALNKYLAKLTTDGGALERAENRLAAIISLERKYGTNIQDVLSHLRNAQTERDALISFDDTMNELKSRTEMAARELLESSQVLHERRYEASLTLSKQIVGVLQKLSMPNATMDIVVEARRKPSNEFEYGPDGYDAVTFLFTANRGEPVKPFSKIASGGELSRTLLAVKAVLAEMDDIDTLIFDEIDTGVSGSAAEQIAKVLQEVAGTRQVLCVTHSAQVAAAADAHYRISKSENSAGTTTQVEPLNTENRISEIARLLGSGIADDTAFQHAKALRISLSRVRNIHTVV